MSDNHAGYQQHAMDGDAAAKTMDKGASAALPNTEFGDGIYEASKPRAEPAGDKASGAGTVCRILPIYFPTYFALLGLCFTRNTLFLDCCFGLLLLDCC